MNENIEHRKTKIILIQYINNKKSWIYFISIKSCFTHYTQCWVCSSDRSQRRMMVFCQIISQCHWDTMSIDVILDLMRRWSWAWCTSVLQGTMTMTLKQGETGKLCEASQNYLLDDQSWNATTTPSISPVPLLWNFGDREKESSEEIRTCGGPWKKSVVPVS